MANMAAAFAMAGPCVAAPEASVASSHGSMPVLYTVQAPVSVVASQSPAMSRHEMPMLMYVLSMALLTAAKPSGMLVALGEQVSQLVPVRQTVPRWS